jgi:hypothetical protein
MNRRSFIAKATAIIAAIPLVKKLAIADTPPLYWRVDKLPALSSMPSGDFSVEGWVLMDDVTKCPVPDSNCLSWIEVHRNHNAIDIVQ